MKQRFRDVGDCLTDPQLLELADCYHEILRWRRNLRSRYPALAPRERASWAEDEAASGLAEADRDGR